MCVIRNGDALSGGGGEDDGLGEGEAFENLDLESAGEAKGGDGEVSLGIEVARMVKKRQQDDLGQGAA